ncbi:MAG: Asp-tRNA(Asn)/Glu-tRNA(Gln) amidotransferase subunit GatB [Candidatus Absconditabacteria bacterium]
MTDRYEIVIGLEIHIKLNSENKMFCQCKNEQEFGSLQANTNICPVCTAQPGALPVLNKQPLEKAIMLGHELNCKINELSGFERKSYFYPDLPVGFQITQLEMPTNGLGYLDFFINDFQDERKIRIDRAHLENDAGKTIHENGKGIIDFNRAGTPLVEIVTFPDFRSDIEVVEFLKELQRRVKFNKISGGELDKGQMRCDVNISLRLHGQDQYGTKVEIKNMNSFGAIQRAIHHEYNRQQNLLDAGKSIDQETRGWDDVKKTSYTMRSKEDSLDYRYFPEPDLPVLQLDMSWVDSLKSTLVESSYSRIKRYKEQYGFNKEYINSLIQSTDVNLFFEDTVSAGIDSKLAANWMLGYLLRCLNDSDSCLGDLKVSKQQFIDFCKLIQDGKLADAQAKQVIVEMLDTGKNAEIIIEEKGFKPVDSGELDSIVKSVIASNPGPVNDVKEGKMQAIGFLVGAVMKESKGKANPKQAKELVEKYILN